MSKFRKNREDGSLDIVSISKHEKAARDFRVTFDFYTPRAHFVVLGRQHGRWLDIIDMSSEYQEQVIRLCLDVTDVFKLKNSVLSFHRGSWITTKDNFHAHICTDVEAYLNVFHDISSRNPMRQRWPSSNYVTGQWKASKDPKRYDANVQGYPYKSYKDQEIRDILALERSQGGRKGEVASEEGCLSEHRGRRIVFHKYKRQIGLSGEMNRRTKDVLELISALESFTHDGLGVVWGGPVGCQVCVDLTGKGFPDFQTDEPVFGYLFVSGPMFYQNCPKDQRRQWFINYKESEDTNYT